MSEKQSKNGQNCPCRCPVCVKQAEDQEGAVFWATWLNTEFRGHLVHPLLPTFCGFQASDAPNNTRSSGHLVEPEGCTARARLGPVVGALGSPVQKKLF